ncbi:glycosyltransferase family 39 protein [Candidatus Borrarchaeum sp.]|uniref:glycosyltransferase family 39 protein n=1 Tax=Candidatus Borrarchaeum sp. TaxID=2846742 RepID=UPI0025796DB1|nr:glycosyltransferase family 39 protein [Candidatus Borrarchaeum sp.]
MWHSIKSFHNALLKSIRFKLFIAVYIIYQLGIGWGVHQMDEWAHYIMIIALVEDNTFIVTKYVHYIYFTVGFYEGNYYVAKAPGLSFLGIPIYMLLKILDGYVSFPNHYQYILISFVAVISALTVVLVHDVCRLLNCSERTSILTAILSAFGIAWTHSKRFEDGSVSPFFLLMGIYLLMKVTRNQLPEKEEMKYLAFAGVSIGYALLVEYTNVILLVPIISYVIFTYKAKIFGHKLRQVLCLFSPIVAMGLVILGLNQILFDSPFSTAYTYHTFGPATEFSITYIPQGLFKFLIYSDLGGGSLFFYQPLIFFTSTFGFFKMYKLFKRETLLFIASILLNILFFSMRVDLGGGFHYIGPGYIHPVLPLLIIPTALTIETFNAKSVSIFRRRIFWSVYLGLFAFSVVVIGACVLAYNFTILNLPIAYIGAFELLKSGYLDPRLLKHRFLPSILVGILLYVVFWDRRGTLKSRLRKIFGIKKKKNELS